MFGDSQNMTEERKSFNVMVRREGQTYSKECARADADKMIDA